MACDISRNRFHCLNAVISHSAAAYGDVDLGVIRNAYEDTGIGLTTLDCAETRGHRCLNVGLSFLLEPQDLREAEFAFLEGCNYEHAESCYELGDLYLDAGEYPGAVARFETACALDYMRGCTVSRLMRSTQVFGVVAPGAARRHFEREGITVSAARCDLLDARDNCYYLAQSYLMPQFGSVDRARGREFLAAACEAGHPRSCGWNGSLYQGVGDFRNAERFYRSGCDLDDAESCENLGEVLSWSAGPVYSVSGARAAFAKACRLGSRASCNR